MSLPKQRGFLAKYGISRSRYKKAKVKWAELESIYDDFTKKRVDFQSTANYIVDMLREAEEVHSLRFRVKNAEHLIEKIIRKRYGRKNIGITNYQALITDLVGVRALHLFKDDWLAIHNHITATWDLHEKPVANIRKGDSPDLVTEYKDNGCDVKDHEYGYRSVHYLVRSQPAKSLHITEVQVRTIFEEGWSQIDHRIRYPYGSGSVLLDTYLSLFNRLAGSADEMGTFVKALKSGLAANEERAAEAIRQQEETVKALTDRIDKLEIEKAEKDQLLERVAEVVGLPGKYNPCAYVSEYAIDRARIWQGITGDLLEDEDFWLREDNLRALALNAIKDRSEP